MSIDFHVSSHNLEVVCKVRDGSNLGSAFKVDPYISLKLNSSQGEVTIFPSFEQLEQLYHTLGAFMAEHPEHFIKHSISEKVELKSE